MLLSSRSSVSMFPVFPVTPNSDSFPSTELGGSGSTAERLQPFFSHAQSQTPSIRLAAITFCATASKLQPSSSPIAIDPAILLALIEKEPTLRGPAAQTFGQSRHSSECMAKSLHAERISGTSTAYLVSKDPDAQRRAVSANCFATFRKVMEGLPSLVATVQAGVTLEDDVRTRKVSPKAVRSGPLPRFTCLVFAL